MSMNPMFENNTTKLTRDRNRERQARMAQVVEQFATRLTLRPVRCRLASSGVAPAWSTSNTISLNAEHIGDLLDPRVVTATRGLALHEVSHILFTPRSGSDLMSWVLEKKLGRAFNALEDQRIETLMVGRFGASVVDWLTYMVAEHLLDSQEAVAYSFPLIRGRKYLPVELRRAVRDLYVNQQDVAELSAIIDEYRVMTFPEDTDRACELIARYNELVKQAGEPPRGGRGTDGEGEAEGQPNGDEGEGGWARTPDQHRDRPAGEHESNVKSKPLSKREQERAKANAEAGNEQDEAEDETATNNADQPTNEPAEDEFDFGDGNSDWEDEAEDADGGQTSDSTDTGSDSDSDGSDSEPAGSAVNADPDSDSDSDSEPSSEAGTAGDPKLNSILENTMDTILERLSDQLAEDIAKFNGDVLLEGEKVGAPAPAESVTQTVSAMAMRASKAFGVELERLRAEFDPAWERRTSNGRINAQRYLTGANLDEVFDQWSEGRDDVVDIEAVILLDTSGSMQGNSVGAYESMWAIKRALDRVNAGCTVLTYSNSAKLLYSNTDRATSAMKFAGVGGGTSPLEALRYSTRVLADSSRAVKILFTITDGQWSNAQPCDKLVQKLRQAGVLTAMAYVGQFWEDGTVSEENRHNCELVSHITSTADLFHLGRQLVRVATKRNLTK